MNFNSLINVSKNQNATSMLKFCDVINQLIKEPLFDLGQFQNLAI